MSASDGFWILVASGGVGWLPLASAGVFGLLLVSRGFLWCQSLVIMVACDGCCPTFARLWLRVASGDH